MDEKLYNKILQETDNYDVIGELEYQNLCQLFKEKDLQSFIEVLLHNCNEDTLEGCAKKYQFFLEKEGKEAFKVEKNMIHDDIVTDWLNTICAFPLLTVERERELGYIILEGREKIIIEKICLDEGKEYSEIDFGKLFLAIDDVKGIKLLTKLYKTEVISIEEKKKIKTYLEKYDDCNRILELSDLKRLFPTIDFDQAEKLPKRVIGEQTELLIKTRKAKKELMEHNLRLVVFVAKKFYNQELEKMDLISEGNIGLHRAIEKYDVRKGFRFSTYAICWIKQTIIRSVTEQSRAIRIPVNMFEKTRILKNAIRDYQNLNGYEPTDDELENLTGYTKQQIKDMKQIIMDVVSLDTPIGEDKDTSIIDFVSSEKDNVESIVNAEIIKEQIGKVLDTLTPRDRKIICMRYGIDDGKPQTLEAVGKNVGVTRERVRQIETKIIRKLRHPSRANLLEDLL